MIDAIKNLVETRTGAEITAHSTMNHYRRMAGQPEMPLVFGAMITGVALPQFRTRLTGNAPLQNPYPTCTDPVLPYALDDCTFSEVPDGNGRYPDQYLPCEMYPVRYRWREVYGGFDSEICGHRLTTDGERLWRQMFYAVNTAHYSQDQTVDYAVVPLGTQVLIAYGEIGFLTSDEPKYGFFFHHMADPMGGAGLCPPCDGGQDPIGCCSFVDGITFVQLCMTQDQCNQVTGAWVEGVQTCGDDQCF